MKWFRIKLDCWDDEFKFVGCVYIERRMKDLEEATAKARELWKEFYPGRFKQIRIYADEPDGKPDMGKPVAFHYKNFTEDQMTPLKSE